MAGKQPKFEPLEPGKAPLDALPDCELTNQAGKRAECWDTTRIRITPMTTPGPISEVLQSPGSIWSDSKHCVYWKPNADKEEVAWAIVRDVENEKNGLMAPLASPCFSHVGEGKTILFPQLEEAGWSKTVIRNCVPYIAIVPTRSTGLSESAIASSMSVRKDCDRLAISFLSGSWKLTCDKLPFQNQIEAVKIELIPFMSLLANGAFEQQMLQSLLYLRRMKEELQQRIADNTTAFACMSRQSFVGTLLIHFCQFAGILRSDTQERSLEGFNLSKFVSCCDTLIEFIVPLAQKTMDQSVYGKPMSARAQYLSTPSDREKEVMFFGVNYAKSANKKRYPGLIHGLLCVLFCVSDAMGDIKKFVNDYVFSQSDIFSDMFMTPENFTLITHGFVESSVDLSEDTVQNSRFLSSLFFLTNAYTKLSMINIAIHTNGFWKMALLKHVGDIKTAQINGITSEALFTAKNSAYPEDRYACTKCIFFDDSTSSMSELSFRFIVERAFVAYCDIEKLPVSISRTYSYVSMEDVVSNRPLMERLWQRLSSLVSLPAASISAVGLLYTAKLTATSEMRYYGILPIAQRDYMFTRAIKRSREIEEETSKKLMSSTIFGQETVEGKAMIWPSSLFNVAMSHLRSFPTILTPGKTSLFITCNRFVFKGRDWCGYHVEIERVKCVETEEEFKAQTVRLKMLEIFSGKHATFELISCPLKEAGAEVTHRVLSVTEDNCTVGTLSSDFFLSTFFKAIPKPDPRNNNMFYTLDALISAAYWSLKCVSSVASTAKPMLIYGGMIPNQRTNTKINAYFIGMIDAFIAQTYSDPNDTWVERIARSILGYISSQDIIEREVIDAVYYALPMMRLLQIPDQSGLDGNFDAEFKFEAYVDKNHSELPVTGPSGSHFQKDDPWSSEFGTWSEMANEINSKIDDGTYDYNPENVLMLISSISQPQGTPDFLKLKVEPITIIESSLINSSKLIETIGDMEVISKTNSSHFIWWMEYILYVGLEKKMITADFVTSRLSKTRKLDDSMMLLEPFRNTVGAISVYNEMIGTFNEVHLWIMKRITSSEQIVQRDIDTINMQIQFATSMYTACVVDSALVDLKKYQSPQSTDVEFTEFKDPVNKTFARSTVAMSTLWQSNARLSAAFRSIVAL
jgi:hypothetical protein